MNTINTEDLEKTIPMLRDKIVSIGATLIGKRKVNFREAHLVL